MKFLLSLLTTGLLTIGLITTGVMSGTCFADESIYFAGPLFNQAEKDQVKRMIRIEMLVNTEFNVQKLN